MFSSKSFLGFVFKSTNHFEFIFIYDMRFRSRFFFIACGCVGVPAPLIEKIVLSPLIAFGALSKTFRHTLWELFLSFLYVSLIYVSVPLPIQHSLDDSSYVSLHTNRVIHFILLLKFFFFLPILVLLPFHMNFSISLSIYTKYFVGILTRIIFKPIYQYEKN